MKKNTKKQWPIDGRITRSKTTGASEPNPGKNSTENTNGGNAAQAGPGTISPANLSGAVHNGGGGGDGDTGTGMNIFSTAPIFLEPVNNERPFPTQPIQVGRILKHVGFTDFSEIRKLGKFRFRLEPGSNKALDKLQEVDLKANNLKIYNPPTSKITKVFVRGIPLDFGDDELLKNTVSDYPVLRVERLKRRTAGRSDTLEDTTNLKVTVESSVVPRIIEIFRVPFKCELYVYPIRQCQNCWRYGHKTTTCSSSPRCKACSGKHKQGECSGPKKCVNCRKEHCADDRSCEERKRRQNILQAMKEKKITYTDAEKEYPKLENRFELLEVEEQEHEPREEAASADRPTHTGRRGGRSPRRNSLRATQPEPWTEEGAASLEIGHDMGNATDDRDEHYNQTFLEPNPFTATEFERLITKLRQFFLFELRSLN